jgi:hypothetical protein
VVKILFPELCVILKSFAFSQLRWNDAGYKNNMKIILQIYGVGRKSSKRPMLVEGKKLNGKSQFISRQLAGSRKGTPRKT